MRAAIMVQEWIGVAAGLALREPRFFPWCASWENPQRPRRADLEMTGQVHALNHLKACRDGPFVPNPTTK